MGVHQARYSSYRKPQIKLGASSWHCCWDCPWSLLCLNLFEASDAIDQTGDTRETAFDKVYVQDRSTTQWVFHIDTVSTNECGIIGYWCSGNGDVSVWWPASRAQHQGQAHALSSAAGKIGMAPVLLGTLEAGMWATLTGMLEACGRPTSIPGLGGKTAASTEITTAEIQIIERTTVTFHTRSLSEHFWTGGCP